MIRPLRLAWPLALVAVAVACSDDGDAPAGGGTAATGSADIEAGQRLYAMPLDDGNSFACATCHAMEEPATDGLRRPGHPIGDAFGRNSFKNGQLSSVLDAVNTCLSEWMNVREPWTEATPRWQQLAAYLADEAANRPSEEVAFEIVEPPADLTGGDADRGRDTFNETCVVCHGQDGQGTVRAPQIVGTSFDLAPELIVRRVRTSGRQMSSVYTGLTGGIMPFWAADRLSDDELRDVIAYVATSSTSGDGGSGGAGTGGTGAGGSGAGGTGAGGTAANDAGGMSSGGAAQGGSGQGGSRDCAATHPLVGKTAIFSTFAHDVAGTATIVDDCTVRVDDFHFDGGGIVVRLYTGSDPSFAGGFSVGPNLVRPAPYEGETLTFQLEPGQSWDDVDRLSVWCVPVGVSFGDGVFQ